MLLLLPIRATAFQQFIDTDPQPLNGIGQDPDLILDVGMGAVTEIFPDADILGRLRKTDNGSDHGVIKKDPDTDDGHEQTADTDPEKAGEKNEVGEVREQPDVSGHPADERDFDEKNKKGREKD